MALQGRTIKDPTTALNRYKSGVGSAAPAWLDGVLHPRRGDFRLKGAAAENLWFANLQAAHTQNRYSKNLQKVTDAEYENAVQTYGQNNYQTQATAKSDHWGAFYNKFAPVLEATIKSLPPRGTKAQNRARLNAYLDSLEKQGGSFRVR